MCWARAHTCEDARIAVGGEGEEARDQNRDAQMGPACVGLGPSVERRPRQCLHAPLATNGERGRARMHSLLSWQGATLSASESILLIISQRARTEESFFGTSKQVLREDSWNDQ